MRTIRLLVGTVLVALLTLAVGPGAASAAGNGTSTYRGTFGGSIVYVGCKTTGHQTTSGTWAVTLNGNSAKATFDISVNGVPHVAYTFPGMKVATVEGTVFAIYGRTGAGLLTVTLFPSGDMTYKIAPYSYEGLNCTSVTYPGDLTS